MKRDWTQPPNVDQDEILRWSDVHRLVKLSRNTVRKLEKIGEFPKRFQLTDYSVGWLKSDVDEWIASRRAARKPADSRIA